MSKTTDTPPPTGTPPAGDQPPTGTPPAGDQPPTGTPATDDQPSASTTPPPADDGSTNGEAARYRVRMREAETARDALAGRLTAMQRRECETIAAKLLEVPADLWDLGGANPDEFYGDDDQLDADALRAAVDAVIAKRPGLALQRRASNNPSDWGVGLSNPRFETSTSWADVLGK